MKRKLQNIAYLLMAAAFVASCSEKKQISEFPDWAWTDFQRPEGVNPIISPDTTTLFYCPMRQDSIAWEQVIHLIRLLRSMMESCSTLSGCKILRQLVWNTYLSLGK